MIKDIRERYSTIEKLPWQSIGDISWSQIHTSIEISYLDIQYIDEVAVHYSRASTYTEVRALADLSVKYLEYYLIQSLSRII